MGDDSTHGTGSRGVNRRSVLAAAGAAGIAGLAGCTGLTGGGGGSDTVTYGVVSPMSGAFSGLAP